MRLIDADALMEKEHSRLRDGDVLWRIPPSHIDLAPTIDLCLWSGAASAAALNACAVIEESLSPREEFDNDEEYIDYLISVIHGLETSRQRQREMITALEQKLAD